MNRGDGGVINIGGGGGRVDGFKKRGDCGVINIGGGGGINIGDFGDRGDFGDLDDDLRVEFLGLPIPDFVFLLLLLVI
jgi:hypothetical protein